MILESARLRSVLFQGLVFVAALLLFYLIFENVQSNLEERDIASGFSFLNTTAGFNIIQHLVDYAESDTYGRAFVVGLLNTLLVSFIGIILATILGFLIGVARLSSNWLVNKLASIYIEMVRNIPLLLQIFFWYFIVLRAAPHPRQSWQLTEGIFLSNRGLYISSPELTVNFYFFLLSLITLLVFSVGITIYSNQVQKKAGRALPVFKLNIILWLVLPALIYYILDTPIHWHAPVFKRFNFEGGVKLIPEFLALLSALSIYTAGFIAEIVRAGIQSVSQGQKEAARALGLRASQRLRLVIIPQAMRVIIPPLTNQYLNLMKNSSLAAAIAYPDLVSVFAGTVLNQTGQAIEVIGITMAVYLTISLSISLLMNLYQKSKAWMV